MNARIFATHWLSVILAIAAISACSSSPPSTGEPTATSARQTFTTPATTLLASGIPPLGVTISPLMPSVVASPAPNTQSPLVAFSSDGRLFATTDGLRLVVWDVGHTQKLFEAPLAKLLEVGYGSLAFAPDNHIVALAADGQVVAWRVPGGEVTFQTQGTNMAFSPDGATLVVASGSNQLVFWDIATDQKRAQVSGSAPQYASDGRLLINRAANTYAFVDAKK